MATPDENGSGGESRSSVKLSRNAKGETQIEVKVYSGDEPSEVDVIKAKAVEVYEALRVAYPV